MRTKLKVVTGKILFELTIVALGILLAIAINSWYQENQQKKQANDFLKKIEYEMSLNLKQLNEVNITFVESIKLTNSYISDFKSGKKIDPSYSLNVLAIDSGVWRFTQHRDELDRLPIDMLIAISESYRALDEAKLYTSELAFSKFDKLLGSVDEKETLIQVARELKKVKFHLDYAQMQLKNCLTIIEQYHPV